MIRDDLISQITTNLASYTAFNVVSDLPYDASGQPLYQKNFKTVYIDEQEDTKTQLYRSLDQGEVFQTDTGGNAYITVDAKNQPSDIDNVITGILNAKSVVTNTQLNEATYETEIEDDYITYTFEYNFTNV